MQPDTKTNLVLAHRQITALGHEIAQVRADAAAARGPVSKAYIVPALDGIAHRLGEIDKTFELMARGALGLDLGKTK